MTTAIVVLSVALLIIVGVSLPVSRRAIDGAGNRRRQGGRTKTDRVVFDGS